MIDTLDYYRERNPREPGTPRDRYDLISYQDWREASLDYLMGDVVNDDAGDSTLQRALIDLITILKEDPRR